MSKLSPVNVQKCRSGAMSYRYISASLTGIRLLSRRLKISAPNLPYVGGRTPPPRAGTAGALHADVGLNYLSPE